MNLSDYQKSGNAFGTNVTEYPKFSVLKGKIPDVPGITSLPYIGGYIFQHDANYYEAFFGSRYQIITPNGFVFYNLSAGASPILKKYILTSNFTVGEFGETYDPFRQSIGSVPFQYPGKSYTLLKNSGDTDWMNPLGGYGIAQHASTIEEYSKGVSYDLPFNYFFTFDKTGLHQMEFSSLGLSPFGGDPVPPTQTEFGAIDSFGDKYRVFDFKKEQYIYLKTNLPPEVGVEEESYPELIDRHRLNFLSLFFEIPHKSDGYTYHTKGLDTIGSGINRITFDNSLSPFDYDRTIEREKVIEQKDASSLNVKSSFYRDGLLGESTDQKSKEISSIAFQRFNEIEKQIYTDYSFDVESAVSVVQYIKTMHGGSGPGFMIDKVVKIPVPAGVPVNPITIDGTSTLDEGYLTADIFSSYNHLNTTWENALESIPEIAIPNVYEFANSTDKGLSISHSFSKLGHKVVNCIPYEQLVKSGMKKKLIFIGDENLLKSVGNVEEALPMYNNIEFDIYSNANREIHKVLHKSGIYKDFLLSILTHIYGPTANYEYKSDLSQKTEVGSESDVLEAHSAASKSILGAQKYLFTKPLDQRRLTSLKPFSGLPSSFGSAMLTSETRTVAFDFEKWYQYYLNYFEFEYNLESTPLATSFLDKVKYKPYFTDFSFDTFKSPYETKVFQSPVVGEAVEKLKSIFAEKMRVINNILSKEPSYSEPIMYRIEKRDINDNVIQNIFIPHFADDDQPDVKQILAGVQPELKPNIKKCRYIDSQVKYGKLYRYKITQYRIVVASEYRYVFSTNKKTDNIATALGYGDKYDSDTIMRSGRQKYEEGPIVYNDVTPEGSFEPGFLPLAEAVTPFQFYSKISNLKNVEGPDQFAPIIGPGGEIISKESFPKDHLTLNNDGTYQYSKIAIFKSILYPSIRIEEVPYYEEEVIISDFPPIPPNVNFDPLVNKGSQLLMTFENQTGDREEIPVSIENSDEYLFSLQRTAQGRNVKKDDGSYVSPSLRFKSDDFAKTYQVFKSDTAPSGYGDFSGKKYKDLDVEEATAFIEVLEPNKTFYYMFRTVDIHDNVSNPSAVFAVQMTFNSGVYYPVVNTYEFNQQSIGSKYKEFQQYLKIEASMIQRLVNKEKSSINDASSIVKLPILGIGNQSLWNQKKFKFRIISKHTGKIIDLNVKFNTNHTQPDSQVKGC